MTDEMRAALEKRGRVWGQPPAAADKERSFHQQLLAPTFELRNGVAGVIGSGSFRVAPPRKGWSE